MMSASDSAIASIRERPDQPRRALRDWFAFDQNTWLTNYVQSCVGRIVLLLLFTLFCSQTFGFVLSLGFTTAAAVCAYCPRFRTIALFSATLTILMISPSSRVALHAILSIAQREHISQALGIRAVYLAIAGFFIGSFIVITVSRHCKTWVLARRPVMTLLATVSLLCGVAASSILHGLAQVALWAFIIAMVSYLWFLAYALVDQRTREPSPALFQLGTFHPFWGSTTVPFGKGAAYLRKTLSKTRQDLAVTQIKGLKLLIWALMLQYLESGLSWLFNTAWILPNLNDLQTLYVQGQAYSIASAWGALIWTTADSALHLAVGGHQVIAIARLAGFRLPRNTWRPLEARTIAEYWNRYYFYFKELLVDFFFFPTFLRVFRKHPRLRTFFATFMAAGVGNAVFHFFKDIQIVAEVGLWNALISFESYLFYCFMLALGISISQVRMNRGIKPSSSRYAIVWSFLCVWGFVLCLHIFGDESRNHSLYERLSFMASLFGFN